MTPTFAFMVGQHRKYAEHAETSWRDQFMWVAHDFDDAVLLLTFHPDVTVRTKPLLMLERTPGKRVRHDSAGFVAFDTATAELDRFPFGGDDCPSPSWHSAVGGVRP